MSDTQPPIGDGGDPPWTRSSAVTPDSGRTPRGLASPGGPIRQPPSSGPYRLTASDPQRKYVIGMLVFAALGGLFAAVSTRDFVLQLDRQIHAVSCSFVPGMGKAEAAGGCYAVMMSPYSSFFRTSYWGGIPIALPALSVFAYLVFAGLDLLLRRRDGDPRETRWLLLATALPLATSAIYAYIAAAVVGSMCKVCVGIYVSSTGAFALALAAHLSARRAASDGASEGVPWGRHALQLLEGVAFVAVPLVVYVSALPAYGKLTLGCGELVHPEDKYGVRVKLAPAPGGAPALEVLDPLCPACKAFRDRLRASDLAGRLDVQAVLFPLDSSCNWMVTDSLHPGACAVSEAALCAGDRSGAVVDWALDNNEELRALGGRDPGAVVDRIKARFPELATCVGSAEARSKINRSLRWVASNSLPVLTPQLFVRGRRLCDEDTDLGLEYALTRLLEAEPVAAPAAPAGGERARREEGTR